MRQTAIVVAPGRGTYNKTELGYLRDHHADKQALLSEMDDLRSSRGQKTLSDLDQSDRFSSAVHTRGDNASALIHACAYCDFLSIDRDRFDIIAVTGNSMGWYIALTCAGVLEAMNGLKVVNTMGTLMQEHLIGGQLVYSVIDDDWREIPGKRQEVMAAISEINALPGHFLGLSIDLGGMLVVAGDDAGLAEFESRVPKTGDRFPMRLPNHAGFHTALQSPVAALGREALHTELFDQPKIPLIDGRGAFWWPKTADLKKLYDYTLNHQVVAPFDFTRAVITAARELMPDVFIVLGPGATLGGAVAQSLIRGKWLGWREKGDFKASQKDIPRLLSMGITEQRHLVTGR